MKILKDIFNVFFPESCCGCKAALTYNEEYCCLKCIHEFPLTYFSFNKDNLVEQTFYGRIPLIAGTSLLFFHKGGIVQQLIYNLKYRRQQQIGTFIGNWLAADMLQSGRFSGVQAIIPVPLHRKKQRKRGYNQVTRFGESLAEKMNVPFYENVLSRVSSFESQTKKIRFDRWKNVNAIFVLNQPVLLENKHILLIDDVITTGATLEACYRALKNIPNLKISIACIAFTE